MYPAARTKAPHRRPSTASPSLSPAFRLALAFCLALLSAALTACGPDSPAQTARSESSASNGEVGGLETGGPVTVDGAGRVVALEAPARRVISMMPSVTEWIVAMGAADRLVARTDYDDQPSLDTLPSVGGGLTPSVEWLAARRPDLVVAWPDAPSRSLVARLGQLDIPVYSAPSETVEEGLATARDLGTLLGVEAAADAAIAEVRAGLDSVSTAVTGRERPSVLFLIGLDPLMAAGPGTFVDQLVTRAGGRNVLADLDIRWPQISLEEVVRRAPEFVIVGSTTADPLAELQARPGWRDVPAVRDHRVVTVDPNAVNRPGPGMDEAAARLARILHGELPGLPGAANPLEGP